MNDKRNSTYIKGHGWVEHKEYPEFYWNGKLVIDLHVWEVEGTLNWLRSRVHDWHWFNSLRNDQYKTMLEDDNFVIFVSSPNFFDEELFKVVTFIAKAYRDGSVVKYRLD